jgi:hypothetical protein
MAYRYQYQGSLGGKTFDGIAIIGFSISTAMTNILENIRENKTLIVPGTFGIGGGYFTRFCIFSVLSVKQLSHHGLKNSLIRSDNEDKNLPVYFPGAGCRTIRSFSSCPG